VGQDRGVDVVLGKAPSVLGHAEFFQPIGDLLHRGSAPRLAGFNPPAPQVYPQWVQRWSRADLTACAAGSGPCWKTHGRTRLRAVLGLHQSPGHPAMWATASSHGTSGCLMGRTGDAAPASTRSPACATSALPLKADVCHCVRHVAEVPQRDSRSAANKFHHSITWSARAKSVGGIVNPSALAVFRLMTSSNLMFCWTGRSAGLAPLRIFPT
jgi:hypothetical protein